MPLSSLIFFISSRNDLRSAAHSLLESSCFPGKDRECANANLSVGCNHFSIRILNTTVYLYIERNAAEIGETRGCAAGPGMVFDLSVLNRIYNFV